MRQDIDRLQQILSRRIIPHFSSGEATRMILAQRPIRLPDGIRHWRRPAPRLKAAVNNRSNLFLGKYPEEGVHAIRYPYLCYVIDGEIDIRLGIPAQTGKNRGIVTRYEILTLTAHSVLLIPPGVFFPNGKSPYWERPETPSNAQIFWLHILPTGLFCHSSTSHNAVHTSDNLDIFIPGQHFATLIDIFQEDLHSANKRAINVAKETLLAFLSRVSWKLNEGSQATTVSSLEEGTKENIQQSSNSLIIQRACEFIRKHNNTAFTVEEVAAYAYVSPSHLMRLFRSELQTTVMEYALNQRLTVAEAWLKNSEMPIKQIANSLGYRQAPQFNRIFKQIHGISPTEFRRRCHKQES